MLIRKDELFMLYNEVTGDNEMIPIEPKDAYDIKETLIRDDIEEILVEICETNEIFMSMVEEENLNDENFIDNMITDIIKEKDELLGPILNYIANKTLSMAYMKYERNKLASQLDPNVLEVFDIENYETTEAENKPLTNNVVDEPNDMKWDSGSAENILGEGNEDTQFSSLFSDDDFKL